MRAGQGCAVRPSLAADFVTLGTYTSTNTCIIGTYIQKLWSTPGSFQNFSILLPPHQAGGAVVQAQARKGYVPFSAALEQFVGATWGVLDVC